MSNRRQFTARLGVLGAAGLLGGLPPAAWAQLPELARLLVGFPPGGSTDNVARRLADRLRGAYAGQVLVDNKPGAATQIAVAALKEAPADGLTMLLSPPAPFSIYPFTYRKLPYGTEDQVPVAMVCSFPFAFAVGPAVPDSVRSIPDFVAWAKANPGKASFGSPAAGSTPHLVGSLLGLMAGVELTHVAYRGDAPGLQDLMGGQLAAYSSVLGSFLPQLKSGRIRLLAVSGAERSSFMPGLPTYREQGYELDMTEWFGLFLPGKAPAPLVQRLADAARVVVGQADFARGLAEFGMTARYLGPRELAAQLRTETEMWRGHVKKIGFTSES